MVMPSIAIIGAGNMGKSLIGGLIKDGYPKDKLWATDPSEEKLVTLNQLFQIHTTSNNQKAAENADVIIFAVKPQIFTSVAKELKQIVQTRKILILSIAAGIRVNTLADCFAANTAIVRAMPNTPALIGCGATALYANQFVTSEQRDLAESILRAVGVVVWILHENEMDTVTALSGCGPAYFFLMMEALEDAAHQLGLSRETAHLLTLQTALGAIKMAIESDESLSKLRNNVASPGGSTEKALLVLEEHKLRQIFHLALLAAKNRSEELATLLGETQK